MSATDLQTPIIDGAIRSTNFFNGRLLSARDLTLNSLRIARQIGV